MKATRVVLVTVLLVLGLLASARDASAVNLLFVCQPLTSGSYILNMDVAAPAASPCFTMTADNISLNLGGHTVNGSTGVAAITDGGVSRRGISVASGTIYADIAIDLLASSEVRIQSLTIESGSIISISAGPYSKLLGNIVYIVGGTGIQVQCPALLVWNIVAFSNAAIVKLGKGCKELHNVTPK